MKKRKPYLSKTALEGLLLLAQQRVATIPLTPNDSKKVNVAVKWVWQMKDYKEAS